jgi:hypothetical protein
VVFQLLRPERDSTAQDATTASRARQGELPFGSRPIQVSLGRKYSLRVVSPNAGISVVAVATSLHLCVGRKYSLRVAAPVEPVTLRVGPAGVVSAPVCVATIHVAAIARTTAASSVVALRINDVGMIHPSDSCAGASWARSIPEVCGGLGTNRTGLAGLVPAAPVVRCRHVRNS